MSFLLEIDGVAMPTPSIKGFNVTISSLDASAKRNAKGYLRREKLRDVRQIDIQWSFLSTADYKKILDAVVPAFFNVKYMDPQLGQVTKTFYVSDRKLPIYQTDRYENLSLTLVEQ